MCVHNMRETQQELRLKHRAFFKENISIHCSCANALQEKEELWPTGFSSRSPLLFAPAAAAVRGLLTQSALCPKRGEGSRSF